MKSMTEENCNSAIYVLFVMKHLIIISQQSENVVKMATKCTIYSIET